MAKSKFKKKSNRFIQNRKQLTREMLMDVDSWPHYPILPLKRVTVHSNRTQTETGVVLFRSELFGHGITAMTVFRMNLFEIMVLEDNDSIVELVSQKEYDIFETAEAMIQAGWIVD